MTSISQPDTLRRLYTPPGGIWGIVFMKRIGRAFLKWRTFEKSSLSNPVNLICWGWKNSPLQFAWERSSILYKNRNSRVYTVSDCLASIWRLDDKDDRLVVAGFCVAMETTLAFYWRANSSERKSWKTAIIKPVSTQESPNKSASTMQQSFRNRVPLVTFKHLIWSVQAAWQSPSHCSSH